MQGIPGLLCPRCGIKAELHRARVLTDAAGRFGRCRLSVAQVYAICAAAESSDVAEGVGASVTAA